MVGLHDCRRSPTTIVGAIIRHGVLHFVNLINKTVDELVNNANDKLFTDILYNKHHVLIGLLPAGTTEIKYYLIGVNVALYAKNSIARTERDFITRLLFKDVNFILIVSRIYLTMLIVVMYVYMPNMLLIMAARPLYFHPVFSSSSFFLSSFFLA